MSAVPDLSLLLGAGWALPLVAMIPLLRRRPDVAHFAPNMSRRVSIIVPARNEGATIDLLLSSLRESRYDNCEILVVDDRSEDDTAARVHHHALLDPRIRLLPGAPLPAEWFGKPWACHQGVAASTGELLLFVDADTSHHPDLLAHAVGALLAENATLLTLTSHQRCETFWERLVMPQIWLLLGIRFVPERINRAIRQDQVVANGQFILVHRAGYDQLGGHAAVRSEVVEDLALAQQAFRTGLRVRMMFGESLLSTRMYRTLGQMIEGWSKNLYTGARQSMSSHPLLMPLAPLLVMGVFLFWLLPPLLFLAGILPGAMAIAIGCSLVVWALVNRGMRIPLRYTPGYPLGAVMALAIMIRSTIRGRRKIVWKGREYAFPQRESDNG